jgi:hypothetical protein
MDWNTPFAALLDRLRGPDEAEAAQQLRELFNRFAAVASEAVQDIVDDLSKPLEERRHACASVGGLAGGLKYVVPECGLFVKFASNAHGIYACEEHAAKSPAHELNALIELMDCKVPGLRFPLMAVIDYCGFRASAQSILPIGPDTLVYGSPNGGETLIQLDAELAAAIESAASRLRLAPFDISRGPDAPPMRFFTAVDLEGHRGRDGAMYIVDCARSFPPDLPSTGFRASRLVRLLRGLYVRTYSEPLCCEGFSPLPVIDIALHNRTLVGAVEHLRKVVAPRLAMQLERHSGLPERFEAAALALRAASLGAPLHDLLRAVAAAQHGEVCAVLRREGINMRYLGLLRNLSRDRAVSTILLEEAVARTCKQVLRSQLRKLRPGGDGRASASHVVLKYFQLLFGSSAASEVYWSRAIKSAVANRFQRVCLTAEEEDPSFDLRLRLRPLLVWARVDVPLGLDFVPEVAESWHHVEYSPESALRRHLVSGDLRALRPCVRGMHRVAFEEATAISREATRLLAGASGKSARPYEMYVRACELYRDSVGLLPGDVRSLENWGVALLLQARARPLRAALALLNEAASKFDASIAVDPTADRAHFLLGWAHVEMARSGYLAAQGAGVSVERIASWIETATRQFDRGCVASTAVPGKVSDTGLLSLAGRAYCRYMRFLIGSAGATEQLRAAVGELEICLLSAPSVFPLRRLYVTALGRLISMVRCPKDAQRVYLTAAEVARATLAAVPVDASRDRSAAWLDLSQVHMRYHMWHMSHGAGDSGASLDARAAAQVALTGSALDPGQILPVALAQLASGAEWFSTRQNAGLVLESMFLFFSLQHLAISAGGQLSAAEQVAVLKLFEPIADSSLSSLAGPEAKVVVSVFLLLLASERHENVSVLQTWARGCITKFPPIDALFSALPGPATSSLRAVLHSGNSMAAGVALLEYAGAGAESRNAYSTAYYAVADFGRALSYTVSLYNSSCVSRVNLLDAVSLSKLRVVRVRGSPDSVRAGLASDGSSAAQFVCVNLHGSGSVLTNAAALGHATPPAHALDDTLMHKALAYDSGTLALLYPVDARAVPLSALVAELGFPAVEHCLWLVAPFVLALRAKLRAAGGDGAGDSRAHGHPFSLDADSLVLDCESGRIRVLDSVYGAGCAARFFDRPEARGSAAANDLWGLGCLLLDILVPTLFRDSGGAAQGVLLSLLHGDRFAYLRAEVPANVSDRLVGFVSALLSPDPVRRCSMADELLLPTSEEVPCGFSARASGVVPLISTAVRPDAASLLDVVRGCGSCANSLLGHDHFLLRALSFEALAGAVEVFRGRTLR